jgi:hypothetical protein
MTTQTFSGPIVVSSNNQVIQNLIIVSSATGDNQTLNSAIHAGSKTGLVIRNCAIYHAGGCGIHIINCPGAIIDNCTVIFTSAPASGPNSSEGFVNIGVESCNNVQITNCVVMNGSAGVQILTSSGATISYLSGFNMHGDAGGTTGQLVQFNQSTNCTLQFFSIFNDLKVAFTEDNINVNNSTGTIIHDGSISGNNSPSGVGVQAEENSTGSCTDVDVSFWSNGAFSAVDDPGGFTFTRCRALNQYSPCSQERGPPDSDGLCLAATGTSLGINYNQIDTAPLLPPPATLIFQLSKSTLSEVVTQASNIVPRFQYGITPIRGPWTGPTTGLLHRWPMDDANVVSSSIKDVVANLNATSAGAGVVSAGGPSGYPRTARALVESTLTGYATLPSSPIANFANPHSVFIWCEIEDDSVGSPNGGLQTICGWANDANNLVQMCCNNNAGQFLCIFYSGGVEYSIQTSDETLFTRRWLHIGYTWTGLALKLYVNNVAIPTQSELGHSTPDGGTWLFGARVSSAAVHNNWEGRAAQCVVYNHALSPSEINTLYNADAGISVPVSIQEFSFNAGSEWQLLDRLAEPRPQMPELPWL